MPGFKVNNVGGEGLWANPNSNYFTKYQWEITQIFGVNIQPGTALVNLKTCKLPTFMVEVEAIPGMSHKYKHAKSIDWENVSVTWYDTVGLLPYIKKWRESVWTLENGLNIPNTYKKDTTIYAITPDAQANQKWILFQSWPCKIAYGDLNYADSEVKMVDVDIVYDWADDSSLYSSG